MDTWEVSDITTNARGVRSASILYNGEPPRKRFGSVTTPLCTPYGVSSFEDSTRMNLDFQLTKDLRGLLQQLDEWARKTLLKQSPRFFKRQVSKEELAQMYQSCVRKHERNGTKFEDTVRVKFTKSKLKHWGFNHDPVDPPKDYRECDLVGLVQVKQFVFSSNQVFLVLELSDLMVKENLRGCPPEFMD
jgi:hypothetical protein